VVENYGNTPHGHFIRDARRLDERLDARLADIIRRTDDGEINVVQAAGERIAALEQHLGDMRMLRELHFPGPAAGGGQR
jgi:hypothetical protein